jgi:hypothetical protein
MWMVVPDLAEVSRLTSEEKDLEIVLPHQQLRIVERKQQRGPQIPRWQRVLLVAPAAKLKQRADNAHATLEESVILFKPETLLGWHRELVRRKWAFKQRKKMGERPRIDDEITAVVVQIALENTRWGYL